MLSITGQRRITLLFLGGGLRNIAYLCFIASSISIENQFFFCAGTEALFADLCHFPVLAIQVKAFSTE